MIYFDSAATSFQKPPEVRAAVLRAMETCASPGRGGYEPAMRAAALVYRCRERCAQLFDCAPEQVIFTASATHGLNAAIKDLVRSADPVVVSGFEHNAVMRPLTALGAEIISAQGALFDVQGTLRAFEAAIRPGVRAVVCTHVSNVFGYVLPIEQIAQLCRRQGVPLIVDASQSAGILPLSMRKLQAEYIAMPGHKGLLGPQGTGVLLCKNAPRRTLLEGGTGSLSRSLQMPDFLPDAMEPGTQNVPGIAGVLAGVEFILQQGLAEIAQKETCLCKQLAESVPETVHLRCFSGAPQSGVLSVQAANMDCEQLAQSLAQRQVAVRAGLHCAPWAHRTAGTLETGTVRFSFSYWNTPQEVAETAAILRDLCQERK